MKSEGAGLTRGQWVGFSALCVLWASAWLVDGTWPSVLVSAERQAVRDLVIAVVLGAAGWKQIACGRVEMRRRGMVALASVMLLGVPSVLAGAVQGGVSTVTAVALFAMVPVVVVMLVRGVSGSAMASAVTGLTGILLVLPFEVPRSARQAGMAMVVVAGVVMAAVASVWLHRLLASVGIAEAGAVFALANGVFFAGVFAVSGGRWSWDGLGTEAGVAVLFELPQMVLLVWLMREVLPERFAGRYLVVPLITVMEGLVVLRGGVTVRLVGGMALAAFGVWRLMTARVADEEPTLMLR